MYKLTQDQLQGIANLCKQEQGSWHGAAAEASLASNILRTSEYYKSKYGTDIYSFMRNSGWFYKAPYFMDNGDAGSDYVSIIKDVLVNGNFTLPLYVNEHDCFSDIAWAKNGNVEINKKDRSAYVPHKTRIRNVMGSEYTFYSFPAPASDPFGYTDANKKYMSNTSVSDVLSIARSWIGKKESDSSHKEIINIYNAHTPLARGYKVQYTDAWCATFVSAVFIKLGVFDFLECGCQEMIQKMKNAGLWQGKVCHGAGDIIFYDWNGDGAAQHVGIVENLSGRTVTVIEGNYNDAVGRRTIDIGSASIIGYGRPIYTEGTPSKDVPAKYDFHFETVKMGDVNGYVRVLQIFMTAFGYYKAGIDGDFGSGTLAAVNEYQKRRIAEGVDIGTNGKPDGICGGKMWNDLMGV